MCRGLPSWALWCCVSICCHKQKRLRQQSTDNMEKEYWNSILIILIYILYRFLTTLLETSNLSCFSGGYYVQAFSCGDRLRQLQMKQETCIGLHVNRLDNFFQIINVRTIILIQHYTDDENSAQTNHCECLSSLCYRPISTKYSVCMSWYLWLYFAIVGNVANICQVFNFLVQPHTDILIGYFTVYIPSVYFPEVLT